MDYLLERKRQDPLDFLQPIKVAQNALLSSQPYHNLDINTLLHQTGYLTIRAVDTDGRLVLGFPKNVLLSKSFPKIGTIGAYAVCRAAAAGRR